MASSSSSSAHVLSAVEGSSSDIVPIRRVLVSVFDKTGIVEFCRYLVESAGVTELLSTGGTAKQLSAAGLPVTDVATYTQFPECLNGRVKTLHPLVHGGLLAVRGNPEHTQDMAANGIQPIDMTILNLYPFAQAVKQYGDANFAQCLENIDIGGPSMLRSTAKNHAYTTIVTSPDQYAKIQTCLETNNGGTTLALRRQLAAAAFATSASYDAMIAEYMARHVEEPAPIVPRIYTPEFPLKYGCNPHQQPAQILSRTGHPLPFTVLNGKPGYINLLDAANAWQLVVELRAATDFPAAASFKHCSPAGAAIAATPLTDLEKTIYEVKSDEVLSMTAVAYIRARHADPMCSFGDFCAVSEVVDAATAKVLKKEVSDGIVAKGYTPEALEILKTKKSGKFIILEAVPNYYAGATEYREVYGMTFAQKRNTVLIEADHITSNIVTAKKDLPDAAIRDMILASICLKYTQSNSVGFAKDGMMIGVGAGQQSRVDCVKLAGRKVSTFLLRSHPKVLALQFAPHVKRQDRVNARVRFIEGDFTTLEKQMWDAQLAVVPEPLTAEEKTAFVTGTKQDVTISSDAFFPFRDSIDHASKLGVSYVVQPGGSVQDASITEACDAYGMTMTFTNVRLFHH